MSSLTKATKTERIIISGSEVLVRDLPIEIRDLVQLFDLWNQQSVDITNELTKVNLAKDAINNQIVERISAVSTSSSCENANPDSLDLTEEDISQLYTDFGMGDY